jgi:glycosyltransferase involved in cell wall biosynthesis
MKIAIVIGKNWNSPHIGGGFSYMLTLIGALSQSNAKHEFVFLVPEGEEAPKLLNPKQVIFYPTEPQIKEIPFRFIDKLLNKLSLFSFLIKETQKLYVKNKEEELLRQAYERIKECVEKIINEHSIDLIYYPQALQHNIDINAPYFATFWDLGHVQHSYFPEVSANGIFEYRESFYKNILPKASAVVVESEEGKKNLQHYYRIPEHKVIVLHQFPSNVINCKVSDDKQKEFLISRGLSAGEYFFYPAQFWAHKNHYGILQALFLLKKNHNMLAKVAFTGSDKGNMDYIKKQALEFGLQEQVYFLGFVETEELYILYKNAIALLMPTFLGPTNMPIIEAIYLSCPIICSDIEGHREIAQDAALYIHPTDYEQIANQMHLLISYPELREDLKDKAKIVAKHTKFSLDNAVVTLEKAFDNFEKIRRCWDNQYEN